jgi:tRNA-specific 2-thiouridylase
VAAALLKEQGQHVIGVTMRIWGGDDRQLGGTQHACYGPGEGEEIEEARRVAQKLGIPFHVIDLRQQYRSVVLDYFCNEYLSGRTPNPCVRCNPRIKFGALPAKARENGIEFDFFATGHYAQVRHGATGERHLLRKGSDHAKDQSYFLYALTQDQLAHTLFPLGQHVKGEVRGIARDLGLGLDERPESQDFAAGGYSVFFDTPPQPGPILDGRDQVLGEHRGIGFYTIGQRRGLGIAAAAPFYVTAIDVERNAIIVGPREDLLCDRLVASDLNWIAFERLDRAVEVTAKIRYQHREAPAVMRPRGDRRVEVHFAQPQMAITPGQAVVFYDGDLVVGGGTIAHGGEA